MSSSGQLTDLDEEAVEGKGIAVHDNTANVANNLVNASQNHGNGKAAERVAPADALVEMDDEANGKESDEDGAGRDGRLVLKDTPLDGADGECAVGIGAVGNEAVGKFAHCDGGGEERRGRRISDVLEKGVTGRTGTGDMRCRERETR